MGQGSGSHRPENLIENRRLDLYRPKCKVKLGSQVHLLGWSLNCSGFDLLRKFYKKSMWNVIDNTISISGIASR